MNLTENTNTVSNVYRSWVAELAGPHSSKFEKTAKSAGLKSAIENVITDLKQFEGHGISTNQIAKQAEKLNRSKNITSALSMMSMAMLSGDKLSVI